MALLLSGPAGLWHLDGRAAVRLDRRQVDRGRAGRREVEHEKEGPRARPVRAGERGGQETAEGRRRPIRGGYGYGPRPRKSCVNPDVCDSVGSVPGSAVSADPEALVYSRASLVIVWLLPN